MADFYKVGKMWDLQYYSYLLLIWLRFDSLIRVYRSSTWLIFLKEWLMLLVCIWTRSSNEFHWFQCFLWINYSLLSGWSKTSAWVWRGGLVSQMFVIDVSGQMRVYVGFSLTKKIEFYFPGKKRLKLLKENELIHHY